MVNNEDIMALEKSGQNLLTRVDPYHFYTVNWDFQLVSAKICKISVLV